MTAYLLRSMQERGHTQKCLVADIVVFHPKTIREDGTCVERNQPAAGVQTLLVNAVPVVAVGKLIIDVAPGQPIRRATRN